MASKEWINHRGEKVPAAYVPAIDKKRDRVASKYAAKAERISQQLAHFKEEILAECDEIYQEQLEDANVRTGKKGNYTITSFDKGIKIEVSIQDRIEFDDNINIAQEKINAFLAAKTANIDHDLGEIVRNAFRSRKGQLDNKRVLGLLKYNISHPLWKEAMEYLKKSIDTNTSKRYARIFIRDGEGNYRPVELNFSSL